MRVGRCWGIVAELWLWRLDFQSDCHGVAFGGVFEGVVNQVDQGLLESFAVGR